MADQNKTGMIILISGIVLGAGAAFLGYSASGTDSADTRSLKSGGVRDAAPEAVAALTQNVEQVNAAMGKSAPFVDVAPEGATLNGQPRYMPIFFAPELWQVAVDGKNVVMDIADPQAPNIHAGVPNSWFLKYGMQDVMCQANALDLDSDGDGFSNKEEFGAQTNPADKTSYPAIIGTNSAKLEVVQVIRDRFVIQVDSGLVYVEDPKEAVASVKIFRKAEDTEPIAKCPDLKVGSNFGVNGAKDRFTVLAFERKKFHDSAGGEVEEMAIKVRDNNAVAGEKEFFIRAGSVRPSASNNRDLGTPNERGRRIIDAAAEIRVTAGPEAGKTVRVAEHASFLLPGTKVKCTLESIDESGSVNILVEGAQSPVSVPLAPSAKGAKPAPEATPAEGGAAKPAAGGSQKPAKQGGNGRKRGR